MTGLPDVLKNYVTYRTDGFAGNAASTVGTHETTVILSTGSLNPNNYSIGELPEALQKLEWEIKAQIFDLPDYDGSWDHFDGDVHDLMVLLGYGDDWDNYFEVEVTYDPEGGTNFDKYDVEKDPNVNYSPFNGFYVGSYKLKISLKANINTSETVSIGWKDENGDIVFDPVEEIITCKTLVVDITGWNEDREFSTIDPAVLSGIPQEIVDKLFEYVIYDVEDENKTPVSTNDITDGVTYRIEFRVKAEYEIGVTVKGITYVEFGNYDFGKQPVVWLPIPTLEKYISEYTGKDQTFEIKDWNTAYSLSAEDKHILEQQYGVHIDGSVTKYVYVVGGDETLVKKAAGNYKATIRFISGVNLSWYDPATYKVNNIGQLVEKATENVISGSDEELLIKRTSQTVEFTITQKEVEKFDPSLLDGFVDEIVFNGKDQDITAIEENKAVFKALEDKYGSLISFDGNVNKDTGEYELVISLSDENSCYWETGLYDVKTVVANGYKFTYLQGGSEWKLMLVKYDEELGAYIEYDGNYTEDGIVYKYEYSVNYIPDDGTILDTDGKPLADADKYVLDGDGKAVKYSKNGDEYVVDMTTGTYLAEYVTDSDGNKIIKTVPVVQYVTDTVRFSTPQESL